MSGRPDPRIPSAERGRLLTYGVGLFLLSLLVTRGLKCESSSSMDDDRLG